MDKFDLLKKLAETPGPTGDERAISEAIREVWNPLVDETVIDRNGSLMGIKRGAGPDGRPRPSIMLAAHQDELGMLVSSIIDHRGHGFLRVLGIAGVDRRHLMGQMAVVHGKKDLIGVLAGLPDAYLPEKDQGQVYSWEHLVLDVGLSYTRLRELVSVGDFVTFRQPVRKLLGGRVTGKALDNRASVVAVTVCLELLRERRHVWDVIAVATSQEEATYLGAYTSAYAQRPDAAIAVDVTHAKGSGANDSEFTELGGGPVLGIGANVHPSLFAALRDAAKSLEMKVEIEPHAAGSGTDAFAIQVAHEGIPTGLVSIPLRYMHTMVETADLADIERAGRLLAEMIAGLDDTFLDQVREEMMRSDRGEKGVGEEKIETKEARG